MATQPLETIPEETETETETPTPAPARVTAAPPTTKPATAKSPGRVASGKRLAAWLGKLRKRAQLLLQRPVAQVLKTPTASHS